MLRLSKILPERIFADHRGGVLSSQVLLVFRCHLLCRSDWHRGVSWLPSLTWRHYRNREADSLAKKALAAPEDAKCLRLPRRRNCSAISFPPRSVSFARGSRQPPLGRLPYGAIEEVLSADLASRPRFKFHRQRSVFRDLVERPQLLDQCCKRHVDRRL